MSVCSHVKHSVASSPGAPPPRRHATATAPAGPAPDSCRSRLFPRLWVLLLIESLPCVLTRGATMENVINSVTRNAIPTASRIHGGAPRENFTPRSDFIFEGGRGKTSRRGFIVGERAIILIRTMGKSQGLAPYSSLVCKG